MKLHPIPIVLTDVEQRIASHVGHTRAKANRAANTPDANYTTTGAEVDVRGMAGELAFCKLYNLYPDFSVHPRRAAADAGDAVRFGETIDVKTNSRADGDLLITPWKKHGTIDHYALVVVVEWPARFAFVGFCTREDALRPDRLEHHRNGDKYVVQAGQLTADQIFRRREP